MISTLIDLLGNFYARNDFYNFETVARCIHASIPNDHVSLQFIGLICYRTGRIGDAVSIFEKVARNRKSKRKNPLGDEVAALCYEESTKHNPNLAQAWYDLGKVWIELTNYEQAIHTFRSALIAQPDLTKALTALGWTALHINDLKTAKTAFSRLRALQPNNAEAYRGLGKMYRKRRDLATARACYIQARMLRRDLPGIDHLKTRSLNAVG